MIVTPKKEYMQIRYESKLAYIPDDKIVETTIPQIMLDQNEKA